MNVKIALTSDTHIGITKYKQLKKMFEEMSLLNPDVVVYAGDYCGGVTGYKSVRSTTKLIRGIFPSIPILSCAGNHDYWSGKRPSLSLYSMNMNKIRDAFKVSDIHFLDEYGPARVKGITFVGHTGWYKYHVETNDPAYLPTGLGGDTFRYLQKEADLAVQKNLECLNAADTYRIFVSHFPVINPRDFGWCSKFGEVLISEYGIKKFLSGHFHERREGPLSYECGSDYEKPKYMMIEVET